MFSIRVDRIQAIVHVALEGSIRPEEADLFLVELRQSLLTLQGRDTRVCTDIRGIHAMAPQIAQMIRVGQELGLTMGVKRFAEIVESDTMTLQLQRVARESGSDKMLRRFRDKLSAEAWLLNPDPPPLSSSRRSRP